MAVINVQKFDAPVLRKSAKAVRKVDNELLQLAEDMVETMRRENGIGLAGNQVGVAKRIIVVTMENKPCVFLNPRLKKMSNEKIESDEGCLSFPAIVGAVKRSRSVDVLARDLDMKEVKIEAEGLLARVFQHEIDHLNGVVFLDRAEPGTVRELTFEDEEEAESGEEAVAAE